MIRNMMREEGEIPFVATDFYPQHADGVTYQDREQKALNNKSEASKLMSEMLEKARARKA